MRKADYRIRNFTFLPFTYERNTKTPYVDWALLKDVIGVSVSAHQEVFMQTLIFFYNHEIMFLNF